MELWFSEQQGKHTTFSFACSEQIAKKKTKLQDISVLQSLDYGKVVILDGKIVMSEKDEFIYHEMLIHPSFMIHPSIEKVLVVGFGSGHVLREILKHDIARIDIVEQDQELPTLMRAVFPQVDAWLKRPQVHLIHQEPLSFLRNTSETYDIIVINAIDRVGWNEILYTKECYENCFHALNVDGILVTQQDSIFHEDVPFLQQNHLSLASHFAHVDYYQAYIPTYPYGQWLFGIASKQYTKDNLHEKNIENQYYNTDLHKGAFLLPSTMKGIFTK